MSQGDDPGRELDFGAIPEGGKIGKWWVEGAYRVFLRGRADTNGMLAIKAYADEGMPIPQDLLPWVSKACAGWIGANRRQSKSEHGQSMRYRAVAFVSFLAEETVFFGGQREIRGSKAVAAAWKPFFDGPAAYRVYLNAPGRRREPASGGSEPTRCRGTCR